MTRLPPQPRIEWRADAPFSLDLEDVYFSGDGLSEKRAVFLDGCHLPGAWAGRERFCIGELGFGAGLNFLAAWDLWRRRRPSPHARLDFVSFEGALLSAADAARIPGAWPELGGLSSILTSRWPIRARGVQRIAFPDDVTLTLHIDDIASALPEADGAIDAWFLDGFAPARNPQMWAENVLAQIARLSVPGARVATYTVAGEVRRGLEAAGFSVAKAPGHGRKKERLEAVFVAPPPPERARPGRGSIPNQILVIGAGIAGATTARAFLDRGCRVTVLEAGPAPGAGASGNALALVMPRLDAADSPAARALIGAYLFARRAYLALGPGAAQPLDVRQLARSETERARFSRLLSDPPLDEELLAPLDPADPGAGLLHRGAVAVRPRLALPALLTGADLRLNAPVRALSAAGDGASATLANGEALSADLVIVCAGMGAVAIEGFRAPHIEPRLGQIEHLAGRPGEAKAVADGGYAIEAFGELVFGATFEPAPEGQAFTTAAARLHNLGILARLRPDLDAMRLEHLLSSRAAIRATTRDRFPFAGAPPLNAKSDPQNDPPNEKAPEVGPAPSGAIRLIGGLGSRGFLWAPLLAEYVAAAAFGEPPPAGRSVFAMLDPDRFRRRALRRRG